MFMTDANNTNQIGSVDGSNHSLNNNNEDDPYTDDKSPSLSIDARRRLEDRLA
jgi:hypothetical protein